MFASFSRFTKAHRRHNFRGTARHNVQIGATTTFKWKGKQSFAAQKAVKIESCVASKNSMTLSQFLIQNADEKVRCVKKCERRIKKVVVLFIHVELLNKELQPFLVCQCICRFECRGFIACLDYKEPRLRFCVPFGAKALFKILFDRKRVGAVNVNPVLAVVQLCQVHIELGGGWRATQQFRWR